MSTRWKFSVLLCIAMLMVLTAATYACPMCKDSIPSSDAAAAGTVPGGFNSSVYLMLAGFLTVSASLCGLIFKAVRETGSKAGFPVMLPKK